MTLTIGQPYHVQWLDAAFAWEDPEGDVGAYCQVMGWLINADDNGIRLAFETGESLEDGTRWHLDIPHGLILEITEL